MGVETDPIADFRQAVADLVESLEAVPPERRDTFFAPGSADRLLADLKAALAEYDRKKG